MYGTGINLRVGTGYWLNDASELRAVLTFQSADADLVRLGDLGPSALYAQYSDYQSASLDFGYRRYVKMTRRDLSVYGEGTLGIGFIDSLNVLLSAPQSNLVFDNTDFYDQTAAFTWGINAGVLFRLNDRVDLNAQFGLRHVSGQSDVDDLVRNRPRRHQQRQRPADRAGGHWPEVQVQVGCPRSAGPQVSRRSANPVGRYYRPAIPRVGHRPRAAAARLQFLPRA